MPDEMRREYSWLTDMQIRTYENMQLRVYKTAQTHKVTASI